MKETEIREKMLLKAMEKLPIGVGIYKLTETADRAELIYISDKALKIFGITREEYDKGMREATGSSVNVKLNKFNIYSVDIEKYINSKKAYEMIYKTDKSDGTHIWVRTVNTFEREGDEVFCYTTMIDVTHDMEERHEREKKDELYKLLVKEFEMILFDYNVETQAITYSIPDETGRRHERKVDDYLRGVLNSKVIHIDFRKYFVEILTSASAEIREGDFEFLADFFGKGERWYRASYKSIADDDGTVFRIIGRCTDIQEEKEKIKRLKNKAEVDSMSNLFNRNTSAEMINKRLANSMENENFVFAVFDIDDFKKINDTCGHPVGDMIIKMISSALLDEFRGTDILGRLGGDEFCAFSLLQEVLWRYIKKREICAAA